MSRIPCVSEFVSSYFDNDADMFVSFIEDLCSNAQLSLEQCDFSSENKIFIYGAEDTEWKGVGGRYPGPIEVNYGDLSLQENLTDKLRLLRRLVDAHLKILEVS